MRWETTNIPQKVVRKKKKKKRDKAVRNKWLILKKFKERDGENIK